MMARVIMVMMVIMIMDQVVGICLGDGRDGIAGYAGRKTLGDHVKPSEIKTRKG